MERQIKPLIYVFWEGESEKAYIKYLKTHYEDVAVIKPHRESGLFQTAVSVFRSDLKYHNSIDATDEIWIFFDTEIEKACAWQEDLKLINKLRRLRKTKIRVRLLMTTACLEYWLLLHYERCAPSIATPEDKDRMLKRVQGHVPLYHKGDFETTAQIAEYFPTAVNNGQWTLVQLMDDGLPCLEDTDERNGWLFKGDHTFTTVHEAITYLTSL